jgi:hypothetical protein
MSDSKQTALWTPGWYELDQSLVLGERQKFWFFQTPPDECQAMAEGVDLVFYNQLDSTKNCSIRYAKIVEMHHAQLGPLLKIDTDGLDYILFPVDGEEIVVNAEEEPGSTYDSGVSVDDWSVIVTLAEVSEPIAKAV